MQKMKSLHIADDYQRFSIPDTGAVADLFRPPESDYQKIREEMLTTDKCIPDDHLAATYWG